MVAEDIVPVSHPEPRRREMPKIWLPERRPPQSGSFAPLLIIGVLAFMIFVPAFLAMMTWTRRAQVAPPVAMVMPEAVAVVPDEIRDKAVEIKPVAARPMVVEPNAVEPVAARPAPVADNAGPVQGRPLPLVNLPGAVDADCPDCVEAKIPGAAARPNREAFETAVQFVRNPQEAARIAKEESKLTMLLHLSGNFEDPGFT
jgi:hypothetical protein